MDRGAGWNLGMSGFNEGFGRRPPPGPPPPGPRPPLDKDRPVGIGPQGGVPPPKPPEGPPPPGGRGGGPWPGRGEKGGMMGDMGSGPMMDGPMGMGMMGMMGPGIMGSMGMGMGGLIMGPGMMGPGMMSGPMGMGMPGPGMMGMGGGGMGGGMGLGFGFDSLGSKVAGGMMGGEGGRGRGSVPGGSGAKGGRFGGGGGRFGGRGSLATGPSRGEANDYCQHFVDTGQRPQNFLRDSHLTDRYEEYPKLKELVMRKDSLVNMRATPPYYLKADLKELPLTPDTFGTKFDVVLIDPPWEEYARRAPGFGALESWTWQEIMALEVEKITDPPSFVFLWCGSAEGLDAGRHCLKKWGFRRCEDICWIKTNKDSTRKASAVRQDANSVLQHTKEHCLMGIKGTVRRANDGHIIHANVDTDIIVSEEPPLGSTEKPEEMYHVIEHFSLGRRRLELFGEDNNLRPGWVTVGNSLSASNFNPQTYASHFRMPDGSPYMGSYTRPPPGAPHLLGSTEEIEMLRPRTPPPGG